MKAGAKACLAKHITTGGMNFEIGTLLFLTGRQLTWKFRGLPYARARIIARNGFGNRQPLCEGEESRFRCDRPSGYIDLYAGSTTRTDCLSKAPPFRGRLILTAEYLLSERLFSSTFSDLRSAIQCIHPRHFRSKGCCTRLILDQRMFLNFSCFQLSVAGFQMALSGFVPKRICRDGERDAAFAHNLSGKYREG